MSFGIIPQSLFNSGASGIVPASGGGTVNFLRADAAWAAPPGVPALTPLDLVASDGAGALVASGASGGSSGYTIGSLTFTLSDAAGFQLFTSTNETLHVTFGGGRMSLVQGNTLDGSSDTSLFQGGSVKNATILGTLLASGYTFITGFGDPTSSHAVQGGDFKVQLGGGVVAGRNGQLIVQKINGTNGVPAADPGIPGAIYHTLGAVRVSL